MKTVENSSASGEESSNAAEVTVTPKGETAAALQSKASQATMKSSLETAVQAKVVEVPNLATALTSGTLADVSTSSADPTEVTVTVTGTTSSSTSGTDVASS